MASKIYIPTTGASDWRRLLADPEKHWKGGYSAISVAERWERSNGLPVEIAKQFDAVSLGPTELLLAIPEWKTRLDGGDPPSDRRYFLSSTKVFSRTRRGDLDCSTGAARRGRRTLDWRKATRRNSYS